MRGGRHFVEFTVAGVAVDLGVIRLVSLTGGIDLETDWGGLVHPVHVSSSYYPAVAEKLRSQRTERWGDSNVHCCGYGCCTGSCSWTDWDYDDNCSYWQGCEGFGGRSGTAGLLLDLNEGTLSAFKNGRRLGVMKDGLGGEYVWFASVAASRCTISMSKGSAPN